MTRVLVGQRLVLAKVTADSEPHASVGQISVKNTFFRTRIVMKNSRDVISYCITKWTIKCGKHI